MCTICTTAYAKFGKKPVDGQTNVTKHMILNHLKLDCAPSLNTVIEYTKQITDVPNKGEWIWITKMGMGMY